MSPMPIPCAMLKVSGMAKIVRTAGAAVSKSLMSISTTDCIMKMPTMTSAGAVAQAGMARMSGDRKRAASMKIATQMAVRPVLPPASTPEADSM
jgi:hypothetical protein